MLRKRSMLALLAGVLLVFSAALAADPASASIDSGQKWVQDSISAQLARKPGGVVDGDSIHYAKEGVTLTYKPPTAPGSAVAYDFAGCSTGEVCLYTTSNVVASGVRLSTGSLWCPWENTNNLLDLRDYGLSNQIRAADNEGGWWAEGIWSNVGVRGEQWKMDPHGILYNLSTTNITFLNVCINENDLEF
ncbi:hypothetical protein ABH920_005248 [Catenulispora sp. EB89]|uniref:hypothetical protein n=1 Tax=Catenulispora sp. EB89 TaxID=3156257 RepID=UPI00351267CE